MAGSGADPSSNTLSGKNVKAPNVFDRAKEELEAVFHHENHGHNHHNETHGLRDDINVNTSISDVKAPNVFERAKEEIEALVEVIHHKKEHDSQLYGEKRDSAAKDHSKSVKSEVHSGKILKAPNMFDRAKEEIDAVFHSEKHGHNHHNESHGLRDDINVDTSISDVKAPNVFERAKEEIEAIVEVMHQKESEKHNSKLYGEKRDSAAKDHSKSVKSEVHSEKTPNLIEKVKEELKSIGHKPHHDKETHGTSDDINENTPISKVKGPNVLERAKEEIEALIQTIHPKKDSASGISSPKEGHNKD